MDSLRDCKTDKLGPYYQTPIESHSSTTGKNSGLWPMAATHNRIDFCGKRHEGDNAQSGSGGDDERVGQLGHYD
jgi:hypothetical protein